MKLADLSKPQWDAALAASRILLHCSPEREDDRQAYRMALANLGHLLPPEADTKDIVLAAARWEMKNALASVMAGLPAEALA